MNTRHSPLASHNASGDYLLAIALAKFSMRVHSHCIALAPIFVRLRNPGCRHGKTKDEESVNIAEDALGYKIGEEPDEVDEALVAGAYGACNFCNKKIE